MRNAEKLHWRPRELLAALAGIHLNLYRARPAEWVQVGWTLYFPLSSFSSFFSSSCEITRPLPRPAGRVGAGGLEFLLLSSYFVLCSCFPPFFAKSVCQWVGAW